MRQRDSSETVAPTAAGTPRESDRESDRDADSDWISRQVEAIAESRRRGRATPVEDLLRKNPGLPDETAIRLIYEDVCLRRDAGQEVITEEVVGRFPHWQAELKILLGCDRLLRPTGDAVDWPEVGEELGTFRLRAELGRGASGRTFLAIEPALADRQVVLKTIPDDQDEHLFLARLQHTHIVPLFSEHTFPERGLRALCMPYLGGASLARVLEELAEIPPRDRQGKHLVEVLERNDGFLPALPSGFGPFRRYLEEASYVDAICWITACLADALQYAHDRGLVHMDVKPSNVLIAGDGQPMLLDFHLARGPIHAGEWMVGRIGGTPGWMSPEQEAGLEATRNGQPPLACIDGRSDVYALGRLLFEALAGSEDAPAGVPLDPDRTGISVGLADILAKCMARDPAARYREAAHLAEDLRRHLSDLPLLGVPNRSLTERWRKWRRRRPGTLARGTAWISTLAGGLVTLSLLGAFYRQAVDTVRADLVDGRKLCDSKRYPEALHAIQRGLDRSRSIPFFPPLTEQLGDQLERARRGQNAAALHEVADLIRFRYGLVAPSGEEAQTLLRAFRTIWDGRDDLLPTTRERIDPGAEQSIRDDLREMALVWADLLVRLAPAERIGEARAEALRILVEADPYHLSPAIERERWALRQTEAASGGKPPGAPPPVSPRSDWEHYDLGRSYLRDGRIEEASQEFRQTLESRPQDFWPNFYEGLCSYRLGRYEEAVSAFRACIALAPATSECYFNRALAAEALGQADRAWADYTHALQRDPRFAAAALNRGILSYRSRAYARARQDFEQALKTAKDPTTTGQVEYNLALVELAEGDRLAAMRWARKAADLGCPEARALLERLASGT